MMTCRKELLEIGDMTLLVDYVMSLQYFYTFETAAEDTSSLLAAFPHESVIDYLEGLRSLLSQSWLRRRIPPGPSLWDFCKQILAAELEAVLRGTDTPWIKKEYDDLHESHGGSGQVTPDEIRDEELPAWDDSVDVEAALNPDDALRGIILLKLQLFFKAKRDGEGQQKTASRHDKDVDVVFNETDRIVRRLLHVNRSPGGQDSGQHRTLPLHAHMPCCCSSRTWS